MNRSQHIRRFNTLLTQVCKLTRMDREDTKRTMIHDVTHGRTLHTEEVNDRELDIMVSFLVNQIQDHKIKNSGDKMRKKILHYCHLMQWYTSQGKLNWDRINDFCKKSGHGHKPLNQYNTSELPTLVSQFEEVYKCFLNKI